jgi:2-polyprenyl-3-methyl-5-hydroxy-6-metoxy-1,4-benzoquinol methylase
MRRSPRVVWIEKEVQRRYAHSRILDVGFVSGYAEPFVHQAVRQQNPAAWVAGIDLDVTGILQHRMPDTLAADARALPFADGSFDVVLFLEVLEHVYAPGVMLREFARVLRAEGEIVLTTPNAWAWWRVARHWLLGSMKSRCERSVYRSYLGAADHVRFYDPLSLMNVLYDHGFETDLLCTKNHAIPFIRRLVPALGLLDLQFYPMNRLGGYICLIAHKRLPDEVD